MKKRYILFLLLLVGCVMAVPGPAELTTLAKAVKSKPLIVIDPGHGGPDGGAEAADGTLEKNLNLEIGLILKKEAERQGYRVIMTREGEDGLYAKENQEKKWRKLEDLQQRKTIIRESRADLVISIHLNSFWPDSSVHGAQVFYPQTGDETLVSISQKTAKSVQDSLREGLQDGSNRIEMGKQELFLFEEITSPIVLVECGFLSNKEDATNLKTQDYQRKICRLIIDGIEKIFPIS